MSADTLDRGRLVKLLGMLGSDHDGEIAAAGRAADRLVRQAGVRWRDVILPDLLLSKSGDAIGNQIDFILGASDALNKWERQFVVSLARQRRAPSEKQRAILDQLFVKCHTARAAA